MATFLKQSTAVDIALGPFVDSADGFTAETGLTISQADVRLKKNNGNWAQKNDANAATHEENGWYEAALNTTDTDTLGILMVAVNESGALPVWREFQVVPAAVYDALVSGTGNGIRVDVAAISGDATAADNLENYTDGTTPMPVNAMQLSGDATAADNAEAFFDGTGYAGTNNVIPIVTTVNGLAANVITAASMAADASAEIADAVWDEDATGHQTQGSFGQVLGDSGSDSDSVWGLVNTNLDAAISSRASQTSVNTIDDFLDTEVAAILVAVDTEVAAILADTDDIQTRLPAALVGGRMDSSVGAVAANAITAAAIAADVTTELRAIASGTSDSGTTTTMVDAARTEADADYWKGAFILFTSGTIAGQCRLITGFDPGTDTITFAPATTQAVATQTYEILPAARVDLQLWLGNVVNALVSGRVDASVGAMAADVLTSTALAASAVAEIQSGLATAAALDTVDNFLDTEIADIQARLPAALVSGRMDSSVGAIAANAITAASMAADASAEIADQVWDEALAGHAGAGSTGAALSAAGSAGDPWSTALPGAYGAGTAGKIVGDNINATVSSRASQASVDTIDDFLDTEVAAIKAKTDNLPSDPADQSAVEAAITSATSGLATQASVNTIDDFLDTEVAAILAAVDTEVAAIKAKTDLIPASPAAVGSAMTLTSGERDAIAAALLDLADAVETGLTTRQAIRLIASAVAGKLSGAATTTITTRNAVQDSKNRMVATVDADGNRSAITYDVS